MRSGQVPPAQTNAAGSPLPGEPVFLAVGKLRRSHGVHGEVLMEVYSDFPERLKPGTLLYQEGVDAPLLLTHCRQHNEGLLLSLEGFTTPEQVGQLRNRILYVKTADRPPLEAGEFYHHQLIGLQVVQESGEPLGFVAEIMETGASDVLVVRRETGPEVLIPVVDEFVRQVDLAQGAITVHLIPGMLSEEA